MKSSLFSKIKSWYNGEVDITVEISKEVCDASHYSPVAKTKKMDAIEETELKVSGLAYKIFGVIFCIIFIGALVVTAITLPSQGSVVAPTVNEVMDRYVEDGMDETGAVNTVAGMILDYRAFDTLGESFVLFTATCVVMILMKTPEPKKSSLPDRVPYAHDDIVRTICRFITPIIMVFGIYILLNGHLSPGGGFSGGAILGAGLILYALVYGEEKAAKVFSPKIIKTVTVCSLSFYALSKAYSFFTGSNHLHSIISTGTPGNIISAGLILPLNIAVGLVVCCTMYSFFMLFRRGSLK